MKMCSVDTCLREVGKKGAKGLCSLHYQRLLRTGDVMAHKPPEQKSRQIGRARLMAATAKSRLGICVRNIILEPRLTGVTAQRMSGTCASENGLRPMPRMAAKIV